ncbi:serine hydrolase domain-containing protein [Nannocystis bainbridge]|uniref:Serine hydrolase n=1 Tax=Nannocystis bainbridge TaxID=2995303 RepID=A0ABT5DZR8_9BACT|nr:serine hydrolase [Nannocystis bainbridge]MDC0719122.1 serine hydrolase [Nannocystis bainbridge]
MQRLVLSCCTVASLLVAREAAAACPTGVTWPAADWPEALVRGPTADAADDYLFTLTGRDEDRKGIRTDGVVIVHRGRIVYERYARGYARHNRHLAWSVSKSFLNAMVGVGVGRGALTVDDSICDHYDPGPELCDVTVGDLLDWGSGIDWNEGYEDDPYYLSSVIAMLYGIGSGDMAAFVASQGLAETPGTVYRYSSGDSVLLSAVLASALGPGLAGDYPWEFVFDPIGMTSAMFERDLAGTYVGSSYVYATPRDLARFGYLALREGCWAGEQLLPEGWIAASTQPNPSFQVGESYDHFLRDGDAVPGRHWWLNLPVPDLAHERRWPAAPPDTFAGLGHWGQTIFVIPSADLVLVRTADDREAGFDQNRYLELALALAAEDSP